MCSFFCLHLDVLEKKLKGSCGSVPTKTQTGNSISSVCVHVCVLCPHSPIVVECTHTAAHAVANAIHSSSWFVYVAAAPKQLALALMS